MILLLVDKPGYLRSALQSLLGVMPEIDRIETADTGLLALKKIREAPPALVLMGQGLPISEMVELTRQIKQAWPHILCLACVETAGQSQSAQWAGVDQILSNSLPVSQLFAAIQQSLENL